MDMQTTLLANALVENWKANYTLSGRLAFIENERQKNIILTQAKELGIRDEVYALANKIIGGK